MTTTSTKASDWKAAFLIVIVLFIVIAGCSALAGLSDSIYSDEECHDLYLHEYVFYGEPGALSEQDYCTTINDRTYLDGKN